MKTLYYDTHPYNANFFFSFTLTGAAWLAIHVRASCRCVDEFDEKMNIQVCATFFSLSLSLSTHFYCIYGRFYIGRYYNPSSVQVNAESKTERFLRKVNSHVAGNMSRLFKLPTDKICSRILVPAINYIFYSYFFRHRIAL